MSEVYGIDVSSWQGKPDWKQVSGSGIKFAILRVTDRYGTDSAFEHNFKGCKDNDIRIGVYKYSYAKTSAEAKAEADEVIKTLAGRKIDLPVFYDLEWSEQRKLPKSTLSEIIKAFQIAIISAGYSFGIYTNKDWYANVLPDDCKRNDFWVACYPYDDKGKVVERLRPDFGIGWQYSSKGKVPGIDGNVDMDVFYKDYKESDTVGATAQDIIAKAKSWLGKNEYDGSHRSIIDIYNSYKPLARGYKVKYTDQWCDTCVSALFISLNAVNLIGGTECGVEEHVKLFKKAGIWIEDGKITPKPGDIIVFNWDDSTQPNDGYSDHIGIVEKVGMGAITTIEGNYKDAVSRRTIAIGWGYIRGYARPKYAEKQEELSDGTTAPTTASGTSTTAPTTGAPSKTPKWVGQVTAQTLNVRTWAGTEYPNLKSYPVLGYGNKVDVCDTVKAKNGRDWYYIRIAGQYYGFVYAAYIRKV